MSKINSETSPAYGSAKLDLIQGPTAGRAAEDAAIADALSILARRFARGDTLSSPQAVADYLKVKYAQYEHEVFALLILDSQHRVLALTELARGSIDGAAVYPREVVKAVLAVNGSAVIMAHNHPSGIPEPSAADRAITERLKSALALIDVRVLDHLVIGGANHVSFAERGWV